MCVCVSPCVVHWWWCVVVVCVLSVDTNMHARRTYETMYKQDRIQLALSDYVRHDSSMASGSDKDSSILARRHLVDLLQQLATLDEIGATLKSQAQVLITVTRPEEYDIADVRQALEVVGAKNSRGLIQAFQALGKHVLKDTHMLEWPSLPQIQYWHKLCHICETSQCVWSPHWFLKSG